MFVDHMLGLIITFVAIAIHTVFLIGVVRFIDWGIAHGVLHGYPGRAVLYVVAAVRDPVGIPCAGRSILWATVFHTIGAFSDFNLALYNSGQNYTTLGYGDDVLPVQWRMLGPIEAMNGLLAWGLTTAVLFAGVQQLYQGKR